MWIDFFNATLYLTRLLEEIIKLRWNDMTPEEKVFVKDNAMRLMRIQVDILSEARHVKDAISRIVVEIAKREWPQHWPSFLTELEGLCSEGGGVNHTGTELVMFVLLRLVEDVAVLQTLEQNQRRKEIYQALTAQMEVVFAFLRGLLERYYQGYLTTKDQEKERHGRVCQAVLETYNAFVEWVPIAHVMANDQVHSHISLLGFVYGTFPRQCVLISILLGWAWDASFVKTQMIGYCVSVAIKSNNCKFPDRK